MMRGNPKKISRKAILFAGGLLLAGFLQAQSRLLDLSSTASSGVWKIKPQAEVGKDSVKIYGAGFAVQDWVPATVP